VTFPAIRTAVIAGALLAFALSFDEIVVTNFTSGSQLTIPKFIFNNVRQPRSRPIVNVVAVAVILVMVVPVYIAQRLAGAQETAGTPTRAMPPAGGGPAA
jgi:putative spermidine/putrescine transport system permease protein